MLLNLCDLKQTDPGSLLHRNLEGLSPVLWPVCDSEGCLLLYGLLSLSALRARTDQAVWPCRDHAAKDLWLSSHP